MTEDEEEHIYLWDCEYNEWKSSKNRVRNNILLVIGSIVAWSVAVTLLTWLLNRVYS